MTKRLISLGVGLCLCTASPALAEQNFSAGVDLTSNYVVNGVTQTNGNAALQAYLEYHNNGFYLGTWMSNVELGDDRLEVDLYAGYNWEVYRKFRVDLGYAHYFYNNTGACCGEFKLTAAYALTPTVGVDAYFAYDPEADVLNMRGTLGWEITDALGFSATYGKKRQLPDAYWDAGLSYAFNDVFSADLRYYGADFGDEGLVLTLSTATSQSTFQRLFANPFRR